jgi:uncharacterized protein YabE (DUF348 family)
MWGMLKNRILILTCIALAIIGGASVAIARYIDKISYKVTLNDDGHIVQIVTMEKTIDKLLDKYDISLGPGDEIEPGLEEEITDNTTIQITRAFKVNVAADGEVKEVYLTKGTVDDVLKKAGITLGDKDYTNYALEQSVAPGIVIKVTRMEEEILVEKEAIPYQVITRKNNNLDQGVERVVQEGKQGELQRKILVTYRDGVEISRKLVAQEIVQPPVDRIIEKGTVQTMTTSRGDMVRYSSVKTFTATAYTHTGNRTRTGIWPKEGIISVDPSVIPLYSTVYIEFPKGWEHLNGFYKAMDTGGAIKGNIIDLFLNTKELCRQFGRKNVKIYFLK